MSKTQIAHPEASLSTKPDLVREPDEFARRLRDMAHRILDKPRDEFSMTSPTDLAGHCYQLSEAYYHGVDDDRRDHLTPQQITFEIEHFLFDDPVEVSHWFLKADSGIIIDLTAEQFEWMNVEVPYDEATGRGFVPPSPSEQSQKLLDVVDTEEN